MQKGYEGMSKVNGLPISNYRLLLVGAGMGSVIADCALRFGFRKITIVDEGLVGSEDVNNQVYVSADIGKYRSEVLSERLLQINPEATVGMYNCSIHTLPLDTLIPGHDVVINSLEFVPGNFLIFDEICRKYQVSVVHALNLGWAGFLTIVSPDSLKLKDLLDLPEAGEAKLTWYVMQYLALWGNDPAWIGEMLNECQAPRQALSFPKYAIGAWTVAAQCVHILHDLSLGKTVKVFPKFYLSSVRSDTY